MYRGKVKIISEMIKISFNEFSKMLAVIQFMQNICGVKTFIFSHLADV